VVYAGGLGQFVVESYKAVPVDHSVSQRHLPQRVVVPDGPAQHVKCFSQNQRGHDSKSKAFDYIFLNVQFSRMVLERGIVVG